MTITLPKRLRGFSYDKVLPVELNDFDVDILLPAFFFQVISQGQDRGHRPNDASAIRSYVQELAQHESVAGFDGDDGERLLERLVRTALIQVIRKGRSGKEEQIGGLTGYTFLTFKPGFPSESSQLRKVPALLYRMLRDQLRGDEQLRRFFQDVFGNGLSLQGGFEPNGSYDGTTDLDTLTRLSIAFLDGFRSTGVRPAQGRQVRDAQPAVADHMARDLRRYLQAYGNLMSAETLNYYFKGLINFELFIYSLKLFCAITDLVRVPASLPPAMRQPFAPSPPELYLDFTNAAGGLSREMATACVRRDIEVIQRFIHANLLLRHLDSYASRLLSNPRIGQLVRAALPDGQAGGPEYLQALVQLQEHPQISMWLDTYASNDLEEIQKESAVADDDDQQGQPPQNEEIERVTAVAATDFEKVILLLVEGQRKKITSNVMAWYWAVGGLTKPHGILAGLPKHRQTWRYAPSNDLLALLVQLASVDIPRWDASAPRPQAVRLQDFLEYLETRFGILVDRPPTGFATASYAAAAKDNLRAMLVRLQQMGVFRDLSDDFTVQRLEAPFAEEAVQRALV